jgi:hypothetical protein
MLPATKGFGSEKISVLVRNPKFSLTKNTLRNAPKDSMAIHNESICRVLNGKSR